MGKTPDKLTNAGYGTDLPADDVMTTETVYKPGTATSDVPGSRDVGMYSEVVAESYVVEPLDDVEDDDPIEASRTQIEQTRSDMSQTIDAIQEKLSPANIANEAKDAVRDATIGKAQNVVSNAQDMVSNAGVSARGFGGGIIETIKQNPIPAALAGLGIGWLLMSGRQSTATVPGSYDARRYNDYPQPDYTGYRTTYAQPPYEDTDYSQTPGYIDENNGGLGQKAGNVAAQTQQTASQMAGQAQDTMSQVSSQVQETAGQVANQAQQTMQTAQSGFQQALNQNPLGVAAAAVAVGLAVGLAIPETQKENEVLGSTRDQLVDQAQQAVQGKAQQAQAVAQEAVGAAKNAAQKAADEQGLTS